MKFLFIFLIPLFGFSNFGFSKSPEVLFIKAKDAKEIVVEFDSENFEVKGDYKEERARGGIALIVKDQLQVKTSSKKIYFILDQVSNVHIKDMKDSHINLSIKKGDVLIENNQGFFSININKGNLEMNNNSGQLQAQIYSAKTKIDQFEGTARIVSYKKPMLIKNTKGSLEVNSFEGSVEIVKSEGSLRYHIGRSNIRIRSYKGSIKGVAKKGSIRGSLKPRKVQIQSESGDINLYFQNAKARVEAQSWEGKIYSPKSFYKDRSGGVSQSSGFITGKGDKTGIVSLKSRSGNIYIQ